MTPVPLLHPPRRCWRCWRPPLPAGASAPDGCNESAANPAANVSTPSPVRPRIVAGTYRGTFGSQTHANWSLTLDSDADDSVHGWYTLGDSVAHGERVLLAGEFEDEALTLEESHNGVDVSGHWDAVLSGDGFSGQWSDINGENPVDVQLHRIFNQHQLGKTSMTKSRKLQSRLIKPDFKAPAPFGSLTTPIHHASTVTFENVAAMRARDWLSDRRLRLRPARDAHHLRTAPSHRRTRRAACTAILSPSGLAAIALVNLALLRSGDEVMVPTNVYGPNRDLGQDLLEGLRHYIGELRSDGPRCRQRAASHRNTRLDVDRVTRLDQHGSARCARRSRSLAQTSAR